MYVLSAFQYDKRRNLEQISGFAMDGFVAMKVRTLGCTINRMFDAVVR